MMNTKKVRLDLSEEDPVGLRQWTPLNQHGASPFHYFGSQTGRLLQPEFQYYPNIFAGHCNLSCQPLQLSIFCRRRAASSEHSRSIIESLNLETIVMLEWIIGIGFIALLIYLLRSSSGRVRLKSMFGSSNNDQAAPLDSLNPTRKEFFDVSNPSSGVNNLDEK